MTDAPSSSSPLPAVMVSTAFENLEGHRDAVVHALNGGGLIARRSKIPPGVSDDGAITSALELVRSCAALVTVIGKRYGYTPASPLGNPRDVSLAELEFDEARKLGIPIVLFVMGDEHPVTKQDVESSPERLAQLEAFRHRAIETMAALVFKSPHEFRGQATGVAYTLRKRLELEVPVGAWRAEFAFRTVLEQPALYELLETLDTGSLREALYALGVASVEPVEPEKVLSRLRGASGGAEPNALWTAWVETVHAAKLRQS